MHDRKYVLMSIKPVYAELIKSGRKTIELRRVAPKVKPGDVLVIYESSPIKRITAVCEIEAIIVTEPSTLWEISKTAAGLSINSFKQYFAGKNQAVGIQLRRVQKLNEPKELSALSENMRAPQSYRYISHEQYRILTE